MKQSAAFESSGWLVIPGFLDAIEVETVRATLHSALAQPRPACMNRPGNDLVLLRWDEPVISQMLRSRERIARLRELIGADDLRWLSGYISSKAPHSPALWWHQDWWCWDHPISFRRAATQVAVLCYLTDTTVGNGALRVLSGSHRQSTPMHGHLPEPHGDEANRLAADHPAMMDCADQVTVPVRAGDAVVLDYRLLHGTHANTTAARRDCILLSFIVDWLRLPNELKAHCAMHPALPRDDEAEAVMASVYAGVLPPFSGSPASLSVNRVPPAIFQAR